MFAPLLDLLCRVCQDDTFVLDVLYDFSIAIHETDIQGNFHTRPNWAPPIFMIDETKFHQVIEFELDSATCQRSTLPIKQHKAPGFAFFAHVNTFASCG